MNYLQEDKVESSKKTLLKLLVLNYKQLPQPETNKTIDEKVNILNLLLFLSYKKEQKKIIKNLILLLSFKRKKLKEM